MNRRYLTAKALTRTGLAAVVLAAPVAMGPSLAQERPASASGARSTAGPYVTPRTPWGDPDLQGWFSNLSENGTPLERPAQFEGRKLEDIKGEELLAIKQAAQNRTVQSFAGPLHAPEDWWQKDLNMVNGSQAWLIIDPPDGKVPAQVPEARARAAARADARRGRGPSDSYEDRGLYDRCITRGLPGSMMPAIYGNSYQILQTPDYVAIRYEMIHETRLIPLDGRPHASMAVRSYMGDARGRWEGDTLVVETTNFRDDDAFRGANGATLRLTERFTRVGPKTVRWAVTVEDPQTWVSPWTFAMPLTIDDSQPVLEYSCHEGNLGLRNILSAARAEEAKTAESPAPRGRGGRGR
ncbi:MAG TPA: hypothetical protein VFY29_16665 [Terriglobia bacterium]|nr:hypothetical protein [Terriglobia bacterium]